MSEPRWVTDPWIIGSVSFITGILTILGGVELEWSTGAFTSAYWQGVYVVWLGLVVTFVTTPAAIGVSAYYRSARRAGVAPAPTTPSP